MQIESQCRSWRTGSCQLHLRSRAFCTVVVRASRWLWGTAPKQFSLTRKPQGMGEVSHPWSQTWAGGIPLSTDPSGVTQSRATSLGSGRFSCTSPCHGEFSFLFRSFCTSDSSFLTCASNDQSPLSFSPAETFLYPTGMKQQHPSWYLYARSRATFSTDANYPNFIYSSGVLGVFYQIRMWT